MRSSCTAPVARAAQDRRPRVALPSWPLSSWLPGAAACQAGPVLADVRLQACLNGGRPPGQAPVTPAELAAAAAAAVAAGAQAVHVHPRDPAGAESLLPGDVGAAVAAVRAAVGPDVEIGVTTGAWAAPGVAERRAAVAAWEVLPDSASVNWHEDGAVELADLLRARGVGIEAGLWTVAAAVAFLGRPGREPVRRILVEAVDDSGPAGVSAAAAVVAVLHRGGVREPLLVHGLGGSTWPVLRWAAERRHAVRIGLEDVLVLPDGSPAPDNAALVRAAAELLISPNRA
jgi:uncharacterized protein (DUF849 family)